MDKQILSDKFAECYGRYPSVVAHAPGRVNLIGEHTDYNQGFVFPAAINFGTWVAIAARDDEQVVVTALDYQGQSNVFSLNDITHDTACGWANYVRGVIKVLHAQMALPKGANLVVTGNVPQGAGLSSSASFEIALLKAFADLFALPLGGIQAALLGQKAENDFVGCSCGIMDQLISAMGKEGHAMLLDCQSLAIQHAPLPTDLEIVIVNSNVKRGLVDSEYNLRRAQCEEAATVMGLTSLREASMEMLEAARADMSTLVYKRARHVITENARTLSACEALARGDISTLSRTMAESHQSMRDDFAITVPPIDHLVSLISNVIGQRGGVRMTGGGFGGCVVALVPHALVAEVQSTIEAHYYKDTGYVADIYVCTATQGAFFEENAG